MPVSAPRYIYSALQLSLDDLTTTSCQMVCYYLLNKKIVILIYYLLVLCTSLCREISKPINPLINKSGFC